MMDRSMSVKFHRCFRCLCTCFSLTANLTIKRERRQWISTPRRGLTATHPRSLWRSTSFLGPSLSTTLSHSKNFQLSTDVQTDSMAMNPRKRATVLLDSCGRNYRLHAPPLHDFIHRIRRPNIARKDTKGQSRPFRRWLVAAPQRYSRRRLSDDQSTSHLEPFGCRVGRSDAAL